MLSLQGIMTGRYVTEEVRAMIVGMRTVGLKLSEIALIVERPIPTISKIISSYYEHGSVKLPKRFRRPKKLSDRDRRSLVRDMKQNRRAPLAEIGNTLPNPICLRTLRKEVHDLGLNNYIAVKKPFLSNNHKAERLAFAKDHSHWTLEDWSKVIWTDEASFEIGKFSHKSMCGENIMKGTNGIVQF